MSDVSRGPGWWQAANGKWYPPQPMPRGAPPPSPPPGPYVGPMPGSSAPLAPGPSTSHRPPGANSSVRPKWLIPLVACGGLFLLVALIGAIGGSSAKKESVAAGGAPETTSTTSVVTTSTESIASSEPPTTPGPTEPPTTPAPTVPPPTAPAPAVAPSVAVMPNVVCMNLQEAQDLIQTTGVFFSRSHDATGQGRSQVMDSNWVVVSQNLAPGTPFAEGDADLGVVKYGERGTC